MSLDMASGEVLLENTITAGEITVRGVADVQDQTTGTATVLDLTVNRAVELGFLQVDDLWKLQGLDPAAPMTVTPTSRIAGAISQVISGDGENTTTVTRV